MWDVFGTAREAIFMKEQLLYRLHIRCVKRRIGEIEDVVCDTDTRRGGGTDCRYDSENDSFFLFGRMLCTEKRTDEKVPWCLE